MGSKGKGGHFRYGMGDTFGTEGGQIRYEGGQIRYVIHRDRGNCPRPNPPLAYGGQIREQQVAT